MESTPTENDSEKKESKKSKKSAEHLGAMLVKPESDSKKADTKREGIIQLLSKEKDKLQNPESQSDSPEAADANIGEFTDEDRHYAAAELVKSEHAAETAEAVPIDPEAARAIESFRHKIVDEDKDPELAYQETLDELENADMNLEPTERTPETDSDAPQDFEEGELIIHDRQAEETAENQIEEDDAAGGAGGTPPPPKRPTAFGGDGQTPGRDGRSSRTGNPKLDRLTPRAYERVPLYGESAFLSVATTEGVIGYLIGRRRGRIKTEKKLLPIQKKLKKEVGNLQQELAYKEQRIRSVARERDQQKRQILIEQAKSVGSSSETPVTLASEGLRVTAPEAKKLHAKPPAERIGHVLVEAQATQAGPNTLAEKVPETRHLERITVDKSVNTMSRAELLQLSEKIYVEGSSLRQIYETHLVGEKGLRRLAGEYLRGGDVKKRLRQEIVEREIDFERDPVLRDKLAVASASGGGNNLQGLLQKASSALPADSEEAAFYKARAAFEADEYTRQKNKRRVIDISFVTVIAVLAAIVAVLVIMR
jgi:hypothetical protein